MHCDIIHVSYMYTRRNCFRYGLNSKRTRIIIVTDYPTYIIYAILRRTRRDLKIPSHARVYLIYTHAHHVARHHLEGISYYIIYIYFFFTRKKLFAQYLRLGCAKAGKKISPESRVVYCSGAYSARKKCKICDAVLR